jgi:hypothetical protein
MPARRPVLTKREHDELEAWARELPDAFIRCRDFGHNWRPFRAFYDEQERGYRRVIKCRGCGTERAQMLDLDGAVRSGYYVHPDGYLKPHGTGVLDAGGRATLRLVSTLRMIEHADELQARRAKRQAG